MKLYSHYTKKIDQICGTTEILKTSFKGKIEKRTKKGAERSITLGGSMNGIHLVDLFLKYFEYVENEVDRIKINLNLMADQKGRSLILKEHLYWLSNKGVYQEGCKYTAKDVIDKLNSFGVFKKVSEPCFKKGIGREAIVKQEKGLSKKIAEAMCFYIDNSFFDIYGVINEVYSIHTDQIFWPDDPYKQTISKITAEAFLTSHNRQLSEIIHRTSNIVHQLKEIQNNLGISINFFKAIIDGFVPGYQPNRKNKIILDLCSIYQVNAEIYYLYNTIEKESDSISQEKKSYSPKVNIAQKKEKQYICFGKKENRLLESVSSSGRDELNEQDEQDEQDEQGVCIGRDENLPIDYISSSVLEGQEGQDGQDEQGVCIGRDENLPIDYISSSVLEGQDGQDGQGVCIGRDENLPIDYISSSVLEGQDGKGVCIGRDENLPIDYISSSVLEGQDGQDEQGVCIGRDENLPIDYISSSVLEGQDGKGVCIGRDENLPIDYISSLDCPSYSLFVPYPKETPIYFDNICPSIPKWSSVFSFLPVNVSSSFSSNKADPCIYFPSPNISLLDLNIKECIYSEYLYCLNPNFSIEKTKKFNFYPFYSPLKNDLYVEKCDKTKKSLYKTQSCFLYVSIICSFYFINIKLKEDILEEGIKIKDNYFNDKLKEISYEDNPEKLREEAIKYLDNEIDNHVHAYNEAIAYNLIRYKPIDNLDSRQLEKMFGNGYSNKLNAIPLEYKILSPISPRVYSKNKDNLFYCRKNMRLNALEGLKFIDIDMQNCHVQVAIAIWGDRLMKLKEVLDKGSLWEYYKKHFNKNGIYYNKELIKTFHHSTFLGGSTSVYQKAINKLEINNGIKIDEKEKELIIKCFKSTEIYKEIKGLFRYLNIKWHNKIVTTITGESFLVKGYRNRKDKRTGKLIKDYGNLLTAISAVLQSVEVTLMSYLILKCQELFIPILWQHDGLTIKCLYENTEDLMQKALDEYSLKLIGRRIKLESKKIGSII